MGVQKKAPIYKNPVVLGIAAVFLISAVDTFFQSKSNDNCMPPQPSAKVIEQENNALKQQGEEIQFLRMDIDAFIKAGRISQAREEIRKLERPEMLCRAGNIQEIDYCKASNMLATAKYYLRIGDKESVKDSMERLVGGEAAYMYYKLYEPSRVESKKDLK